MAKKKGTKNKQFSPTLSNKIEIKDIGWLKPYEKNSRTHSETQIDEIAASITEFGFTNPVLAKSDGTIIAGHGRVMASERLGLKEIPVIILDHLSDTQARALIIADNKLALNAGWDEDILASELMSLRDDDFDLNITGFDDFELDDIIGDFLDGEDDAAGDGGDSEPSEKEVEVPEFPVTAIGDVWILGKHRLMCGDATDKDKVKILMDGNIADMIFTDPPYGVDYEGINNDDRAGLKKLLEESFKNYAEYTSKGGAIYCFHSDRCADIFHNVFRKSFHFSSMIIWEKDSIVLSQTDFQSIHEPCLYGWVKGANHRFYGDRKQRSVWKFTKEQFDEHTTPKPIALVENALKLSSKEKENVIDLFGVSGSTLIACERTNRKCFMMELDPKYVDVIVKRWQNLTKKKAVLSETNRTFADMKKERIK